MENHSIPLHEGLDPIAARFGWVPSFLVPAFRARGILLNRDECRAPMQWDGSRHAGFCPESARPWLPVHPRAPGTNVQAQRDDPGSLLRCYRALLGLRRELTCLQAGALEWLDEERLPASVVAYRRVTELEEARVWLNFAPHAVRIRARSAPGQTLLSNRAGERMAAPASYVLGGHEGVVVFGARGRDAL